MAKKKNKKHTKKSRAIVKALRRRAPTGSKPKKKRKKRAKKRAKKSRKKSVTRRNTVKPARKRRKGSKRKPFSTKVQIGRTKARIVAPPGDTLDVHSSARKRSDGTKVTKMVATVHRGRIVHKPVVR